MSPQLVVLSLADQRLSHDQKKKIASKLVSFEIPSSFPPQPQVCIIEDVVNDDSLWSDGTPCRSVFVSEKSWLIFKKLGLLDNVDWLKNHPVMREEDHDFLMFASFIRNMTEVNDPAERSVKLAKDFIWRSHTEENLQHMFVVTSEHRKKFPTTNKGVMPKSINCLIK